MLSVVVAAYNEETVIRQNAQTITDYLKSEIDETWELILVDDGSSDATGDIISELAAAEPRIIAVHHKHNYGQGRALRTAFKICRGEVIVTLDADLSYSTDHIRPMLEALQQEHADIVLLSPYMKGGTTENVPTKRLILSKIANRYLSAMGALDVATLTCVVRAYQRETLDALFLSCDGPEILIEVLVKASNLNFKVVEIPGHLHWRNEGDGRRRSKMRIARSIGLYTKFGWLWRPSMVFIALAALCLAPGLFMACALLFRVYEALVLSIEKFGLSLAFSNSLSSVFATYPYSFVICGGLLIIGLQCLAFGTIVMQSKANHDDSFLLGQEVLRELRELRRRD